MLELSLCLCIKLSWHVEGRIKIPCTLSHSTICRCVISLMTHLHYPQLKKTLIRQKAPELRSTRWSRKLSFFCQESTQLPNLHPTTLLTVLSYLILVCNCYFNQQYIYTKKQQCAYTVRLHLLIHIGLILHHPCHNKPLKDNQWCLKNMNMFFKGDCRL